MLASHNKIGIVQFNCPVDNFVQLCAALNSGNDDLIFQRQIAIVDNSQLGQGVGATRFPKDLSPLSGNLALYEERENLAFGVDPIAVIVLHLQFDVQIPCLDLIYRSRCGVGEPRKGGADEHCRTHKDSKCAGNQCPLGRFTCHCCFSSLFCIFQ